MTHYVLFYVIQAMSGSAQKMGKSTNKGRVHQHEINSKYTESSFQETFCKALKDQENFTLGKCTKSVNEITKN